MALCPEEVKDNMTEQLDTPENIAPAGGQRLSFEGPKGPLFIALAKAREHYKDLSAIAGMNFGSGANTRKHEYAPLDVVIAALEPGWKAAGLAVIQPFDGDLMHTIVAVGESSMTISTTIPQWSSSQDLGAILTYFRRYQLKGIFCVADTEDNDASDAPGGKGEPLGRKQPSAPKASGPNLPKELVDEVYAAAKEKGLPKAEFLQLAKKSAGKGWDEFAEGDAKKLLAELVMQ